MNASPHGARPAVITVLSSGLLIYALLCILLLVVNGLQIAGQVLQIESLRTLLKEGETGVPSWLNYAMAGFNCTLWPFLVLSAIGLLTGERWALGVARTVVGVDLFVTICLSAYFAFAAAAAATGKDASQAKDFGALAAGNCCCNVLPALLFVGLLAPGTRRAWHDMLAAASSASGAVPIPPPPVSVPAPPQPVDGEVWRPPATDEPSDSDTPPQAPPARDPTLPPDGWVPPQY